MKKVLILLIGMFVSLTSFSKSFRVGDFEYESLKKSIFSNGVRLKKDFSNKENVVIPEFIYFEGNKYIVEAIGSNAFKDNKDVCTITIPGSVSTLEYLAFSDSKRLRKILFLPATEGLEEAIKKTERKYKAYSVISPNLFIGLGVFKNCEALETLDFSNRRTYINVTGDKFNVSFFNCNSLKKVFFGEVFFSNEKDKLFRGCHSIEKFFTGNKNPSKYKKFFEKDSPFITHEYPKISSMSNEEFSAYAKKNLPINDEDATEVISSNSIDKKESTTNVRDEEQKISLTQDIMTVPMQRKDLNGNICALLKVIVAKKGLTFEGNVIGNVEYKNGNQYWVYLSPGTKKIKINIPGEKTKVLDLDEYKDFHAFESKRIYEYYFETTPTQKLNLTYTPTDAMILIDGNLHDGQNGEIHIDLPLGEHSYMVVAKGYATSEGIVKLTSNGQANIIVNLTPAEK